METNQIKKPRVPWNKGKKGVQIATEETRKKLSLARLGNKFRVGKTPWNKGLTSKVDPRILSGDKCGSWKGGKAKDRRTGVEYRIWRTEVFKRDDYTCQICKTRGCYLEADHIKSWANFPELRYSLENGRTLCKECHKTTDNYKGRGRRSYALPSNLGHEKDNGNEQAP